MKAVNLFKTLLLLILVLVATSAAQKAPGPKYDPATETTFKGVVDDVKEVPNSCLGETGLYVVIKTPTGTMEVQIAPVNFLKEMEMSFAKGDTLEIIASKVQKDGTPFYIARQVTRQNNELVVRDKKGEPVWTWMKKG